MRRLHLWLLALLTPMLWGPRVAWLSQEGLPAPEARSADLHPIAPNLPDDARHPHPSKLQTADRRRLQVGQAAALPIPARCGIGAPRLPGHFLSATAMEANPAGSQDNLEPYGSTLPPPEGA